MGTEVDEGMVPVVVGCSPQPGREKYEMWGFGMQAMTGGKEG